jgi:hypothetical protein
MADKKQKAKENLRSFAMQIFPELGPDTRTLQPLSYNPFERIGPMPATEYNPWNRAGYINTPQVMESPE